MVLFNASKHSGAMSVRGSQAESWQVAGKEDEVGLSTELAHAHSRLALPQAASHQAWRMATALTSRLTGSRANLRMRGHVRVKARATDAKVTKAHLAGGRAVKQHVGRGQVAMQDRGVQVLRGRGRGA